MIECENLHIGKEFLASHKWPVALRKTTHDRCYCKKCYSPSKPSTFTVGGHTYVIPRGWTRFGVYVDEPFARHHNVWNTWANCYHGTSIENAKSIVEHRQLLLPRDMTLDGKKLQIREGHIPGEYYFFTTPTIKYAALDCYAHTYKFTSPSNGKRYKIKVVLQCKQKSDSFTVQPETVGARQRQQKICSFVSNDEMEWKTQHRSAIMPYGLMLYIVPESVDDIINDNDGIKPKDSQKITCPHCSQPNVWENGGYKEGTVITCVHETCKKKFQQVNCPHCSDSNVWSAADYKEGRVATCAHETCKKNFQQLNCPHCFNSITWKNADYNAGMVVTCPYENCKKKFQQLNCPHCSGSNIWSAADYKPGKVYTCAHETCKKTFQQINCAHCSSSMTWKNADYNTGMLTTCPYKNCNKTFQQLNCPHCSGSNVWSAANYKEGTGTTCCHENCKKKFQQVNCPHCSGAVIWKNADHVPGTITTCPHVHCKKKFQQVNCYHCLGSALWKNPDNISGTFITCPQESCKKKILE